MYNQIYDKSFLRRVLFCWTACIGIGYFTHSLVYLLAFPLVIYAIKARKLNMLAFLFLLMTMVQCMNFIISPKNAMYMYIQRGCMLLFGVVFLAKMISFGSKSAFPAIFSLLFYVVYMMIPSAFGWSPVVSYLKIILFVCSFSVLVGIAKAISEGNNANSRSLRSVAIAYSAVMFAFSVVLLRFPAIGYMSMEDMTIAEILNSMEGITLFKGMTQHSQTLGPIAALSIVLFTGDYIFGVRRNFWPYNIALLFAFICLWKSASRTAFVTAVTGVTVLVSSVMSTRDVALRWRQRIMRFFTVLILLSSIAAIMLPQFRSSLARFTAKYETADKVAFDDLSIDEITSSRRGALENPIRNWKKSPAIGNGFQVSEQMGGVKTFNVKDILSAPVEKGTWVVAILEEGGLFGLAIFLFWVCSCAATLKKKRCYIGHALLITLLIENLGEFVIFSLTSTGCLSWALVLFGVAMDVVRNREMQPPVYFRYM